MSGFTLALIALVVIAGIVGLLIWLADKALDRLFEFDLSGHPALAQAERELDKRQRLN